LIDGRHAPGLGREAIGVVPPGECPEGGVEHELLGLVVHLQHQVRIARCVHIPPLPDSPGTPGHAPSGCAGL
jgi:hypothetical protein